MAHVYTVPPGRPFLDALARAILAGDLPAEGGVAPATLDLPAMTLILPTRRAARALQDAFLRVGRGRAMLLPRIVAIAEGEEELSLMTEAIMESAPGAQATEIPPAISKLERCLNLSLLVMRWSEALSRGGSESPAVEIGSTPAQAVQLATALAQLMDSVETEGVNLIGLGSLVPDGLSTHWQQTLEFLKIVTAYWPAQLAESGMISPKDRENRLILAEAKRLAAMPPSDPVIVAGVTGSVPATTELIRAVAALPNGAIVLPALDMQLDDESWEEIVPGSPEHPQFGLKKLLNRLGLDRRDVELLPGAEIEPAQQQRLALISEAMRPATTTEKWTEYIAATEPLNVKAALNGLSLIEAPTAQDEAETVALILRETLETPGRTAALVSPDRLLARRVATRLEAWGIRVDDSAGRPFAKTVTGAFLDCIIECAAKEFSPPSLVALLKHPLCRFGLDAFKVRTAARALELAAFRAPYLGDGLDGVEAALERAARENSRDSGTRSHLAIRRLFQQDWDNARELIRHLRTAYAPLLSLYQNSGKTSLRAFTEAHAEVADAIARVPTARGDEAAHTLNADELWANEAGQIARDFFERISDPSLATFEVEWADYADVYRSLLVGENVRQRVPVHPRLSIWGPVEARLQQPDVVIIGSLNEGTWPKAVDPGPWLNRPMRAALGLPAPEEQINRSAHDFISLFGAERVYLTRSLKVDGVPAVPSRWLMRLNALLSGMGLAQELYSDTRWIGWARARDAATRTEPAPQPSPRPAINLRPRRLSVSSIETWIKNPYAIFARDILKLSPLDPVGKEPGADLRGTIIHGALARFAKEHSQALPPDVHSELMKYAQEAFRELKAHPRVAAFWMPRFERFAGWFAQTEPARRAAAQRVFSEISGALPLSLPGGLFTLTARADRVDIGAGGIIITDYKTGRIPTDKEVTLGLSPQLPLEAAIAIHDAGVFDDRSVQAPVIALRYIRASGAEPPGEEHTVGCADIPKLAASVLDGLERLVTRFDDPQTPYRPTRRPQFDYRYDDYAHLARIAEWSVDPTAGEES